MRESRNRDLLRQGNAFSTPKAYNDRLRTKTSKLECIGVGGGSNGYVYLYCSDCGAVFRKCKSKIRPSGSNKLLCPHCEELISSIKKREKQKEILERKELRHQITLSKRMKILPKRRVCKQCGTEFEPIHNEIYCSVVCRKRANNRMNETRRRIKIEQNLVDKDISLIRLAHRDKDKCWLCNKIVDWNDYSITDKGYRITGDNYPSIDHIVALANGGKHSWDNVRLAHFKCNTDKRDRLFTESKNGQIILFC